MIASVWMLLLALGPQQPVGTVELRLVGPLDGAAVEAGSAPTELRLELARGEIRQFAAPVLLPDAPLPLPVAARLSGAPAEAQVVPGSGRHPGLWSELSPTLVGRGLPPLVEGTEPARPGALHGAWILAALVVVMAMRRRPWVAGGLGFVAAVALLSRPPERVPGPTVEVLEGEGAAGPWLRVRGARGRLELEDAAAGWLRLLPGSAPAQLALEEGGSGGRWAVEAPGARIYYYEALPASRAGSGELARSWIRAEDGAWSARGPWAAGSPLPAAIEGGEPPPAWLIAGLPPGEEVLLGLLAGPGERWLRSVGGAGGESPLRR